MFTHAFGYMGGDIVVPSGLIVFYDGASAPSGWNLFTDADEKFIVGAYTGETGYELDDSASATILPNMTSSTNGSHLPGPTFAGWTFGAGSYSESIATATGGHTHDLSINSYELENYTVRLIQTTVDQTKLPANALFLSGSGSDLSSLYTSFSKSGKMVKVGATPGENGGDSEFTTTSGNSSSSGSQHWHMFSQNNLSVYAGVDTINSGITHGFEHTHGSSITLTNQVKRKLLSAWTKASDFSLISGVIALWDQALPPNGWSLCDGTNGTVDLRQYFIEFADYDEENTTGTGDNTVSVAGSLDSDSWTHTHAATTFTKASGSIYHGTASATHDHSFTGLTDESFTPDYYALHFIQHTG